MTKVTIQADLDRETAVRLRDFFMFHLSDGYYFIQENDQGTFDLFAHYCREN